MSTLHVENFASVELLRAHRTLGISPGDLAPVIEDEARRAIEEAGGSRQRAIGLGIRRRGAQQHGRTRDGAVRDAHRRAAHRRFGRDADRRPDRLGRRQGLRR